MIDVLLKLNTAIYYLAVGTALVLMVARILGRPARPAILLGMAWIAPILLALRVAQFVAELVPRRDFRVFWWAGRMLLSRRNPYPHSDSVLGLPFVNPPTSFPLFALLGCFSYQLSYAFWLTVSLVLSLGLVEVARRTWNSLHDDPSKHVRRADTFELTAALILSGCVSICLRNGQFGIFVAMMVSLAVLFQVRRQPVLAGLALFGASVKPQTLIPFLILFLRGGSRATWAVLAVGSLVSMLVFCPPQELVQWVGSWLEQLSLAAGEGSVNDFSFRNVDNASILSFSVALDCLGFRDRRSILLVANSLVVLIGLLITFEVVFARRLSSAAHVSLVTCYSMLFMYHRGNHDTSAMVFPLLHACYLASTQAGASRQLARLAAFSILLVMNMAATLQNYLFKVSWSLGPLGWSIRAFVVPYSIWILSALLVFFWTVPPRKADVPSPETSERPA
jgi:Glycosyltransferase family 87